MNLWIRVGNTLPARLINIKPLHLPVRPIYSPARYRPTIGLRTMARTRQSCACYANAWANFAIRTALVTIAWWVELQREMFSTLHEKMVDPVSRWSRIGQGIVAVLFLTYETRFYRIIRNVAKPALVRNSTLLFASPLAHDPHFFQR